MNTKSKCSSLDIISTIPQSIIENFLCLVPIKEAVRTSILSRKWKHNWITIPKLVFIENDMFDKTTKHQQSIEVGNFSQRTTKRITMTKRCKLFYAVNQVLLLHHGLIFEFTLVMDGNDTYVHHDDNINIIRLLECLLVIEHLSYSRWYYLDFAETSDPRELPSTLVHLKYFHLDEMMLIDNYGLEFVALVIRSSLNIEKIKLEIEDKDPEEYEMEFAALQYCSDIWLEHFKELKIVYFEDREGEMEFVKLILAKSPVLEKVTIVLKSYVTKDVERNIKRFLSMPSQQQRDPNRVDEEQIHITQTTDKSSRCRAQNHTNTEMNERDQDHTNTEMNKRDQAYRHTGTQADKQTQTTDSDNGFRQPALS
ncbi:F-box/FBD/LRR-repeat protein-like protein [Tanacetum coccineum]|uniref:F-box/FBD/LRR-repeat protein-like protein n=1 Tax=Tanacetum coccineum TaxID=301880 RepID=A0ABQ5CIY2_9ASTR